jgi:ABC-type nitrate/sulfonate/bicarbonate transport system substrate-binding protein
MENTVPANSTPIRVSVFPGGFNWPLFVAGDLGLFEREGVQVEVLPTVGSVAQMTDLAAGHIDMAMTAFDNIVAYVDGDGEAPIGAQPEFVAVLGSDNSFLSLAATPAIATTAALRGRAVSVDAATTGYAFVLFEMLARAGLAPGSYQVARVGGMVQRWDDLRAGGHEATLLSTPYELMARRAGLNVLARAADVIGPYQGNVAATRRSWAAAHEATVIGFIRGYVAAIRWLADESNRKAACDILQRHVPALDGALAMETAPVLLDATHGFHRDGGIRLDGVETVLRLRDSYGFARATPRNHLSYLDLSYWKQALGSDLLPPSM